MENTTSRDAESQQQGSSPEQGAGLAGTVSRGASEVTEQVITRAQRTRDRLEDELARRRFRLTDRMRDVGEALDSASRKLGDDDLVADCLHYVSGKVDGVASYVESADAKRLAGDLRGAARERPAWFFGGAFVLGLALARFAKSSAAAVGAP
jgi:hypothetical protein